MTPALKGEGEAIAKLLDQPFWRVMSFIVVGLVAIVVWVGKSCIEKLDKVWDAQTETKAIVRMMAEQEQKNAAVLKEHGEAIEQLKLSDRTQEERINALRGAR